jgi:hypothetical protein
LDRADGDPTAAHAGGPANGRVAFVDDEKDETPQVGIASAVDPCVAVAFVLGWELGSVRRIAPSGASSSSSDDNQLLRLDGLPPRTQATLAIDLIDSKLQRLAPRLTNVRRIDQGLVVNLRLSLTRTQAEMLGAVKELHEASLLALAAADSRLGRAYGLGHELADACLGVNSPKSFRRAFGPDAIKIKNQLSDLASSFPPHASRAVVLSLRVWEAWAANPVLNGTPISLDDDWATKGAAIEEALGRQGMLWRDLLAGDKQGQDMLDTDHYLQAARSMMATMASTIWSFIKAMRLPLGLATAVFLLGLGLLLFTDPAGKAVGLLLAILGGLGVTGTGIRTQLGKVTGQLQSELWGAAMDIAIAEAVLSGPNGWGTDVTEVSVPARGASPNLGANLEILGEFRKQAKRRRPRKRIRELLAVDVAFFPENESAVRGRDEVIQWLRDESHAARIGREPDKVDELAPGVLLSGRKNGTASIWRVQERTVRWWRGYDSRATALANARTLAAHAWSAFDDD